MTAGAAPERPRARTTPWRNWCLGAAAVVAVVALVPPLGTVARRTEYAAALQFSLLAIALPALVTLGSPWTLLGLAGSPSGDAPRWLDRLADRRQRHRELPWSIAFIAVDLVVVAIWHAPGPVSSVSSHWWLAIVEAFTLLVLGVGLWLELISSPPMVPRSGHLRRAVLAALSMWVFWILAYLVGLSNHGFYPSFHHVAGGLSAAADEEIAAGVVWFFATVAFAPVIFYNALTWIQSDEDPDAELQQVARAERRRGTASEIGRDDVSPSGP